MRAEWTKLCRSVGLKVEGDAIQVELARGRRHSVTVRDAGATYELHAIVARSAALAAVGGGSLLTWRNNRNSQLMGFRIDQRERLIGEAWVPKGGLTAEEFGFYVRKLAAECDRLEYLLTGADSV